MEWYIALAVIFLVVIGYLVGHKFRDLTHSMIPFNEPLSYIVLAVTLVPLILGYYAPDLTELDPFDLSFLYLYLGFWVGYLIGYLQFSSDLLYVTVHDMVNHTEDTHPIVRYTNKFGQQCWQPQGFKEICKTVFLGNHNPLSLSASVNRTRHHKLRTEFIKQEADSVDMAGLDVQESEDVLFTLFGREVHMKKESRKYTPAPSATESKREWIVSAMRYEDIFKDYSRLQTEAAEARAKLQGAQIKGGAMVLNTLADKNPGHMLMEVYSEDFEEFLNNRDLNKKVKNAVKEDMSTGPLEVAE